MSIATCFVRIYASGQPYKHITQGIMSFATFSVRIYARRQPYYTKNDDSVKEAPA